MLSDLCILDLMNDDFVILDEHKKQIRVIPLFDIEMNKLNEIALIDNDDDKKKGNEQKNDAQIEDKFDLNVMKEFKVDEIGQYENWKQLKKAKNISFEVPNDFDLMNPISLQWFIENIKLKIERQIFDKMELGNLLMNERREFIENQMNEYMLPQKQMIRDKVKQINQNNVRLKKKIRQIIKNQSELETKLKNLQNRMKQNDANDNENKNELIKFLCILQDFDKECNASQYDYNQLEQIKVQSKQKQTKLTKQDLFHLQSKIKASLTNSDKMLKAMIYGLQQLLVI